VAEEVDAELAFHVDMVMQELVARGMSPADARAEAVRRFGDIAVVAAECRRFGQQRERQRSRAEYFGELKQDVMFALRQLRRARSFAATAMLTLALGIGATAAVFSALYAVVLQPFPFANADRIVQILPTRQGNPERVAGGVEFAAIRDRRDAFEYVAATQMGGEFTLTDHDAPQSIGGARVSAEYFAVLGVSPLLGRGFLPSDDVAGAPNVVLVSHRLWASRFASDRALLGRSIRLSEESYTVIGVLPPAFDRRDGDEDLWVPLRLTTEQLTTPSGRFLVLTARLARGVTLAQATDAARAAELEVAARTPTGSQLVGAVVRRHVDVIMGAARERLLVVLGAVIFVLLIACVNVANLLLARGAVRARELAVRAALGAGSGRLVRQLLAESLVLASGGAIAGVLMAFALIKGLVALAPQDVARLDQARVNGVVLAFSFGMAIISSIVAGLVPAIRSASPALQAALREGGRGAAGGATHDRLRRLLVGAEVALAVTLLAGAGLLVRTAWRLQHVNPGFTPAHVMTARLGLPAARYPEADLITQTFDRIRDAAAVVPGVQHAALVSVVPMSGSSLGTRVAPEGRQLSADETIPVDIRYASPEYFLAMGMSLLDGRDFTRDDDQDATPVAVISASLAHRLWPDERALGKRVDAMRVRRDIPNLLTVVGVVDDVRDLALNAPATPTLYMPFTQTPAGMWVAQGRSLVLVTRTAPAPETVIKAIQRVVMSVDSSLPLMDTRSMESWLAQSIAATRFNMLLLTTLATLALVLASIGVYGVVSYFVSQRTREIGVRMALGAAPRHIWRLVLGAGLEPIVWGAVAGLALSLATARLLSKQLYGVTPEDPVTLVSVVAALFSVALIATLVPAGRAMRVSPARALSTD
jgi:predicted permease